MSDDKTPDYVLALRALGLQVGGATKDDDSKHVTEIHSRPSGMLTTELQEHYWWVCSCGETGEQEWKIRPTERADAEERATWHAKFGPGYQDANKGRDEVARKGWRS